MAHYLKFMFQKDVRRIFHHFSELLGIRTTFFAPGGAQLNVGHERPHCRYCMMLREQLGYQATCDRFDETKRTEAAQRRDLISYECHGGMVGATAPVVSAGQVLCFVMVGQFRQSAAPPPEIQQAWRQRHGDGALEQAYCQSPHYDPQQVRDIMALLEMMVKYVASQNMIRVASSPVQPLLQYIEDHPDEMLSLQEAAQLVHRSVSSLSHLFKKATGKGFRQYQIERKLDRAEELFRSSPQLSIAQVALHVGYDDPLYFSKLYKKHRGRSPLHAMRQLRQEFADIEAAPAEPPSAAVSHQK